MPTPLRVIPAHAGIQYMRNGHITRARDYRVRGNDAGEVTGERHTASDAPHVPRGNEHRPRIEYNVSIPTADRGNEEKRRGLRGSVRVKDECLLCVSFTPKFNGYHYKVITAVLQLKQKPSLIPKFLRRNK